ncbi:MAG: hypothetical protein LBT40_07305 [Deltaproteobacteria bacterium]|jgi:hypothetical protein|nr:hypothetical protein [Deltaproteobacteria bacterium]
MPLLKLALIVSAQREIILSAGERPMGSESDTDFEVADETVDTLEGPAHRKVGIASTGSVYLTGAEVQNLDYPAESMSISWYLPGEEDETAARPVDMTKVGLIPSVLARDAAETGFEWHFKVDARSPFREVLFYDSGFQPPFKASDLTLYLTDVGNYGYRTQILSKVFYGHKAPTCTENDWGFPETIAQGKLET